MIQPPLPYTRVYVTWADPVFLPFFSFNRIN